MEALVLAVGRATLLGSAASRLTLLLLLILLLLLLRLLLPVTLLPSMVALAVAVLLTFQMLGGRSLTAPLARLAWRVALLHWFAPLGAALQRRRLLVVAQALTVRLPLASIMQRQLLPLSSTLGRLLHAARQPPSQHRLKLPVMGMRCQRPRRQRAARAVFKACCSR